MVKAFNTAGCEVFADPRFGGEAASLFVCGDDPAAKQTVAGLASEPGMEPADCGPLAPARRLEELTLLRISLAMQGQGARLPPAAAPVERLVGCAVALPRPRSLIEVPPWRDPPVWLQSC